MGEVLTTTNASAWEKWGQHFLATRNAFASTFAQLLQKKDLVYSQNDPKLRAEYDKKVAEGFKKRDDLNKLEAVYKQVTAALPALAKAAESAVMALPGGAPIVGAFKLADVLKKAIGLGEAYYDEDGQLGFAPVVIVIGLATATAMIAAVAYFVTDANKYVQRLNSLQKLQESGLTPEQAIAVVDNQKRLETQQAIFGNPLTWLALGAGALFLVPQVLRMMEKGRANA